MSACREQRPARSIKREKRGPKGILQRHRSALGVQRLVLPATKGVTKLDDDPYDSPVDLEDIRRTAKELKPTADADWS